MDNLVKGKKRGKKSHFPVIGGDKSNDDEPKNKKSKKKQKINSYFNDENQEPSSDVMPKKKSEKPEQSPQKSDNETISDSRSEKKKAKKFMKVNSEDSTKSKNSIGLESKYDKIACGSKSKNKKNKKLKKNKKVVSNEAVESNNCLGLESRGDEIACDTKAEKVSKKKLKKNKKVDSKDDNESNNTVALESRGDEIAHNTKSENVNKKLKKKKVDSKDADGNEDDSASDDESDISDNESANSVSSFNIDSYPSDDEDDDVPSSDEEEANKKRGLPVGAVPSAELEERENRTVFVGNLPKTVERHQLHKWFSRFGKVECVRLRSAPVADLEMPKKVAVIKKSFHENRSNIHAYIRFKDIEGAQNALQANCSKFGEYTLRVDNARHKGGYDGKKAVFVGNVPFSIEENSLINLFSKCGEIDGVRIIRDKETGVGKGFAYVNFKCSSSVPLALKLDGEVLEKRQLRVKPVKYNGKNSHKSPSNFAQKRNNFKFKSGPGQVQTKRFGEGKKRDPSKMPPYKKSKFQGEFSKRKEQKKFKKKSFATKKREMYSKILSNKKKTD